jgi:tetratricopeptide (TPR) repeat protein
MKLLQLTFILAIALLACKPEAKKKDGIVEKILKDTIDPHIKGLSDSIAANPDDAALLDRRANYYLGKHDLPRAKADITKAMNIDSTKAKYFVTLSDVAFMSNKTSESKRALEKAILLEPKNIDAHLKLAELYLYVRQYKISLKHIDEVIAVDKYNAKAYFLKGMDFKEIGDTNRAISSMETTIEQDPEYYNAWMQLGIMHASRKNPIALDYYNGALKINPQSTEALYNKAIFLQEGLGKPNEAKKVYEQLLAVDSLHPHALYNLGYLEVAGNRNYAKGLQYFMKSYRSDPSYADAVYMMGYCEENMNKISEAISDYKTALSLDSKHYDAMEGLKRLEKK